MNIVGQVIGPQQANNTLLNQALGPMTATQIRGQQQLSQQIGQPIAGNQPIMQQQQIGQQGQGPIGVGSRIRAPNVTMGTPQPQPQGAQQGGNFDRQQNHQTIKQLEAMLAEAKRNEMTYQMQNPGQTASSQSQMGSQQNQMVIQQQMNLQQGQQGQGMGQPPIRQQLQAHLQSAQLQRMAMSQPQMQQTPTGVTANPQLKHLLQQQQIRNVPPGPGQPMTSQQMNMNQIRMQQQQQQMMTQMPQQMQQQQQWDQMDFNQQ